MTVKVTVEEYGAHCRVTVERGGTTHSGLIPADWSGEYDVEEGVDAREIQGDLDILLAACTAWEGQEEFELTDEELEEKGGGHWAAP